MLTFFALLASSCTQSTPTIKPLATLQLTIDGLTREADVMLHGPSGFSRRLTNSTTLEDLEAGSYNLFAFGATEAERAMAPTRELYTVNLVAGETTRLTIRYVPRLVSPLNFVATPVLAGSAVSLSWETLPGEVPELLLEPGAIKVMGSEVVVYPADTTIYTLTATTGASSHEVRARVVVQPLEAQLQWRRGGLTGEIKNAIWSPDGNSFALITDRGTIKIYESSSGQEKLTIPVGFFAETVAWSPDGTRIAATTFSGLLVLNAQTGKEIISFNDFEFYPYATAGGGAVWSPDSKHLVLNGAIIDADTGEIVVPFDFVGESANLSVVSPDGSKIARSYLKNITWEETLLKQQGGLN